MNLLQANPLRNGRDVRQRAAFRGVWCGLGAALVTAFQWLGGDLSASGAAVSAAIAIVIVLGGMVVDTRRLPPDHS